VKAELLGKDPQRPLRVGVNLSNFLLVTGRAEGSGDPVGVDPDVAAALAVCLGDAKLSLVPFANPGLLVDAADDDVYDVGLIGAEPERAKVLELTTRPYCETEATYLVRAMDRRFTDAASVDAEGVRVAVSARVAYDLWLTENLRHASLTRTVTPGLAGSLDLCLGGGGGGIPPLTESDLLPDFDALAGLRPWLLEQLDGDPRLGEKGYRVVEGNFMTVQQAIGAPRCRFDAGSAGGGATMAFLNRFVRAAVASRFIHGLIKKHGVDGKLSAAVEEEPPWHCKGPQKWEPRPASNMFG
jgi:polar amino acid transport system substrate-binding protein